MLQQARLKSFNYAVGMFGTSIPINMLKTYAAIYYVDQPGIDHGPIFAHFVDLYIYRCAG